MPLATVHLLALSQNTTVPSYLTSLAQTPCKPLVTSHVLRWIITPTTLSKNVLLNISWDLLLIVPANTPLPASHLSDNLITAHWSITAGIPRSITDSFTQRNPSLLHPDPSSIPPLTTSAKKLASSPQGLELTPELLDWKNPAAADPSTASPVSMLNLLAFHPTPEARESYMRYGKAFAESIGSKRGGNAKVVGKVVGAQGASASEDEEGWDEVALAQYPSFGHFVEMLGSEDYQAVNQRHRVPALRDTCILCTSEVDPVLVGGGEKARL